MLVCLPPFCCCLSQQFVSPALPKTCFLGSVIVPKECRSQRAGTRSGLLTLTWPQYSAQHQVQRRLSMNNCIALGEWPRSGKGPRSLPGIAFGNSPICPPTDPCVQSQADGFRDSTHLPLSVMGRHFSQETRVMAICSPLLDLPIPQSQGLLPRQPG